MNETTGNKRGWRILRRVLITLAVLATLIAIFYTEEDWRGKRAWENCKRELEAKGVVLDWDEIHSAARAGRPEFFQSAEDAGMVCTDDANERFVTNDFKNTNHDLTDSVGATNPIDHRAGGRNYLAGATNLNRILI